jgi:hypothetical protein
VERRIEIKHWRGGLKVNIGGEDFKYWRGGLKVIIGEED